MTDDIERFRRAGHAVVDMLAGHLEQARARGVAVLPALRPDEAERLFEGGIGPAPGTTPEALIERVIAASNHLHSPRFVGHQVTAPLPETSLFSMASALLNNGMAVFEMGPAASAMERASILYLCGALGLPGGAYGVLTSGGSLGNLTALLAARRRAGGDLSRACVIASDQAHYSVKRAAHVMGLGEQGFVAAAADESYRVGALSAKRAIDEARARGLSPFAVVASACTTATGTYDRLGELAELCEREGLWLHVDGAHGAVAALSPSHRHLVEGLGRADSVVCDAHKMLLVPALVTAVLFADGRGSYDTFSQQASYLFREADELPWHDVGLRTVECTKKMMSLELYGALATRGTDFFAAYVASRFELARAFADMVEGAPDFELATRPDANIVCFRHTPAAAVDVDRLQDAIRAKVLERGTFYLVRTALRGKVYLRVTIINPHTTAGDLEALLDEVRAVSRALT